MYTQQVLSDIEQITCKIRQTHCACAQYSNHSGILVFLYDAQGYAYRCRQRRVSGQRELREQVLRLERELTVARTDRDALTAECALLRASCAAGCGLISLKEQ